MAKPPKTTIKPGMIFNSTVQSHLNHRSRCQMFQLNSCPSETPGRYSSLQDRKIDSLCKMRRFVLFFLLTVTGIFTLEVSIGQSFTTTETPKASLYASPNGKLFFRLYRIENAIEYLK